MSEQTKNEKTSCCRPLAAAPAATPTRDGTAPSAPVPSVPEVPFVPSNVGEHETLPEIEEDLRSDKRRFSNSDATAIASRIQEARKRAEQTHQKELDALNEQIADLRQQRDLWSKRAAEIVEKCNEQYAKMKRELANCAKLREACAKAAESAAEIMERVRHKDGLAFNTANYIAGIANDALAAPPRFNYGVDPLAEGDAKCKK